MAGKRKGSVISSEKIMIKKQPIIINVSKEKFCYPEKNYNKKNDLCKNCENSIDCNRLRSNYLCNFYISFIISLIFSLLAISLALIWLFILDPESYTKYTSLFILAYMLMLIIANFMKDLLTTRWIREELDKRFERIDKLLNIPKFTIKEETEFEIQPFYYQPKKE
ncbi:hypothetical protein ES703_66172 [subsurface metagenome]